MPNDPYSQYQSAPQADPYAAYQAPVALTAKKDRPGFVESFLDEVNPMHSIPALWNSLTTPGEAKQAGDAFKNITPDEMTAYEARAKERKRLHDSGQSVPRAQTLPQEEAPGYGEIAGHMAGMGANAALIAGATAGLPPVMRAGGRVMRRGAAAAAESALGVRAIQRGYGKTPGTFAVEETGGLNPSTVAASARKKIGDLNADLENRAATSTTPASLQPARDVIDFRATTAGAGNSAYTPKELAEMRAHLTNPQPGFAGAIDPATGEIAVDQSPMNILRMKREFGKDFTKWNPLHPKGEIGTARNVYRALDDELDRTVPGADDLNQRISSGIPVAERAEATDLNAGVGQRVAHRIAAHSGAMLGGVAGYHAGGIPGLVAGMVLPEVISSPTARMAGARALYGTGKLMGNTAAQRLAQAALLSSAKKKQQAQDPLGLNDYLGGQK